jgi:choline dehydrogenase-like flavoprotein
VLANRLTADGKTKVLVLEAGGDNKSMNVKVPAGLTRLFQSVLDWNLYSNRQQQLDDRNVYMARGKLLGGSSATNATLYHRGTRQDYEQWNMPGWAPQDILPWFVKCENNPDIGVVEGVHGTNGTMHVENPRYHHKLHDVFFQAAKEHGIPYNRDFNNWSTPQEGHGEFQVTQEKGERADMHRQYLKPALGRPNLKVVTRAKTLKLEHEMVNGKPVVMPSGSVSRGHLACSTQLRCGRVVRCFCVLAPCTPPTCCKSAGLGQPSSCRSMTFQSWQTCRASARTCRTTLHACQPFPSQQTAA